MNDILNFLATVNLPGAIIVSAGLICCAWVVAVVFRG